MKFVHIDSDQAVVDYLNESLRKQLSAGKSALWLLSGGSAISISVKVAKLLNNLSDEELARLNISLIDERYGPVGHPDSNWQQLLDAGFDLPGARLHPVLNFQNQETTLKEWELYLRQQLKHSYALGFLGIGPDGHTSGILPNSPAVTATGLVTGYEGGGYQRITTTPSAIKMLNEAVVYAVGEPKWPVLQRLTDNIEPAEQPAQILKQVPKLTIFTDYKQEA